MKRIISSFAVIVFICFTVHIPSAYSKNDGCYFNIEDIKNDSTFQKEVDSFFFLLFGDPNEKDGILYDSIDSKNSVSGCLYYKSGGLKHQYPPYSNDRWNGIFKVFSLTGQLMSETPYRSGTVNGTEKQYDRNGRIRWETNFKDGKKEGIEKFYNRNGDISFPLHPSSSSSLVPFTPLRSVHVTQSSSSSDTGSGYSVPASRVHIHPLFKYQFCALLGFATRPFCPLSLRPYTWVYPHLRFFYSWATEAVYKGMILMD